MNECWKDGGDDFWSLFMVSQGPDGDLCSRILRMGRSGHLAFLWEHAATLEKRQGEREPVLSASLLFWVSAKLQTRSVSSKIILSEPTRRCYTSFSSQAWAGDIHGRSTGGLSVLIEIYFFQYNSSNILRYASYAKAYYEWFFSTDSFIWLVNLTACVTSIFVASCAFKDWGRWHTSLQLVGDIFDIYAQTIIAI